MLKRTGMAEGQVGFKIESARKVVKNVNKNWEVINVIKKTKWEEFPDLWQMHIEHMEIYNIKQHHWQMQAKWDEEKKLKELEEKKKEEEWLKKEKQKQFEDFFEKDWSKEEVKENDFIWEKKLSE